MSSDLPLARGIVPQVESEFLDEQTGSVVAQRQRGWMWTIVSPRFLNHACQRDTKFQIDTVILTWHAGDWLEMNFKGGTRGKFCIQTDLWLSQQEMCESELEFHLDRSRN